MPCRGGGIFERVASRLAPEKSLRSGEEFSKAFFVVGHPSLEGFLGDIPDGRQFVIRRMEAGEQESEKFPFLLDG